MAERAPVRNIVPGPGEELTDARLTEILRGVLQNFDGLYGMYPLGSGSIAKPSIGGVVESSGTTAAGSGFTSEKTGTGIYKIVLTNELPSLAAFVASPIGAVLIVETGAAAKKTFTVAFYTVGGVLTNTAFSFLIKAA